MCGLERGKPGSASFLGRQWHWLNFETSQFINNAALAIRPDAIRRVLALCVVWVSVWVPVFYFLLVRVAESICVLCLRVLHWGEKPSVATWWVNDEECKSGNSSISSQSERYWLCKQTVTLGSGSSSVFICLISLIMTQTCFYMEPSVQLFIEVPIGYSQWELPRKKRQIPFCWKHS